MALFAYGPFKLCPHGIVIRCNKAEIKRKNIRGWSGALEIDAALYISTSDSLAKIAESEFLDSIYFELASKIAEAEFLDSIYFELASKIAEAEVIHSIYIRLAGKIAEYEERIRLKDGGKLLSKEIGT